MKVRVKMKPRKVKKSLFGQVTKPKSITDDWTEEDWKWWMGSYWPTQEKVLNNVTRAIEQGDFVSNGRH